MQAVQKFEVLHRYGKDDLAILYIADYQGNIVEFVESVQPPIPRDDKWVIILSTLYGCPMKCIMCDAGEYYQGIISKEGMLAQIDHIIAHRFPDRVIPIKKLKIQFARMGEPTLNPNVLDLLKELPKIYQAPGLLPCLSTVAPIGGAKFLESLISIKNQYYSRGKFQIQFSIHSTDETLRRQIINPKIWTMRQIAEFGDRWLNLAEGDRKITLNFAVAESNTIDPGIIAEIFDPSMYFIKITPINPTHRAVSNKIISAITEENSQNYPLADDFRKLGYETILSIGEWEENQIGSNCGQFATQYYHGKVKLKADYQCNDYELGK